MTPPNYPAAAAHARVQGTVYVVARVDRAGKVVDAVARQVNLRIIAGADQLAAWRQVLADAALRAARQWTFNPPTAGPEASEPYWQVSVPVSFLGSERGEESEPYGKWLAYVPGPVTDAPWMDQRLIAESGDAVPDHGIFQANPSFHLLTPLNDP